MRQEIILLGGVEIRVWAKEAQLNKSDGASYL